MQFQMEKPIPLFFRDELSEESNFPGEGHFYHLHQTEPAPSIVAAICAALLACGLLDEGSVITAIRPVGTTNPWKMAGIVDLMAGRERFRL